MNWKWLLFSFQARANRAKYWLVALLFAISLVIFMALLFVARLAGSAAAIIAIVVGIAFYIGLIWVGLAVAVKRLHDRNKSGWWLLLFYLAPGVLNGTGKALGAQTAAGGLFMLAGLAITIWMFVELGFLRGTRGPNQYGADPLGNTAEDLAEVFQ